MSIFILWLSRTVMLDFINGSVNLPQNSHINCLHNFILFSVYKRFTCAKFAFLPMVDHLHVPILLDPQLAHYNVVNATCRVCPCVDFIVPGDQTMIDRWTPPVLQLYIILSHEVIKFIYLLKERTRFSMLIDWFVFKRKV